jgi:hypothetical protein
MEIQSLKLVVDELDLNLLAAEYLPAGGAVGNLHFQITPEGVVLKGVYQKLVSVPFETVWDLSVQEGKVSARLAQFKVVGVGGRLLKSALLSQIEGALKREDAVVIDSETIVIDPDRWLSKNGFPARLNLSRVHCGQGELLIEAARQSSVNSIQ